MCMACLQTGYPFLGRYGIFLAEKRAAVQQESGCNSMSHISKMLGSMWTTLTREEKKVVQHTVTLLSHFLLFPLTCTIENGD